MILRATDGLIRRIAAVDQFSNVYGLGRSLIAGGSLLTLLFTDVHVLFRPAVGVNMAPVCNGFSGAISLYCLLPDNLGLAKAIAIASLGVVVIGWRPRVFGIIHWWMAFSFMSSAILVDGGDQVAAVLSLFLIPITLTDRRRWHWQRAISTGAADIPTGEAARRLIAGSAIAVIHLQVAIIYLHAAVAKAAVPEWMNGTALYYWFTDPMFGAPRWLEGTVVTVATFGPALTLLTWSVVALEFTLFAGLFAKEEYKSALLIIGGAFHVGIALIHGLVSFSIIMVGALILFLRPIDREFRIDWLTDTVHDVKAAICQRLASVNGWRRHPRSLRRGRLRLSDAKSAKARPQNEWLIGRGHKS